MIQMTNRYKWFQISFDVKLESVSGIYFVYVVFLS